VVFQQMHGDALVVPTRTAKARRRLLGISHLQPGFDRFNYRLYPDHFIRPVLAHGRPPSSAELIKLNPGRSPNGGPITIFGYPGGPLVATYGPTCRVISRW
jgi:hypothetical protein